MLNQEWQWCQETHVNPPSAIQVGILQVCPGALQTQDGLPDFGTGNYINSFLVLYGIFNANLSVFLGAGNFSLIPRVLFGVQKIECQ